MGLAIITIAASSMAIAQPGTGTRMRIEKDVRGPERMDQLLNLTDEQEARIQKLRTEMQRSMVQHRSKVQLARIDLRELAEADAPDRSAVEKKMKEIADLQVKQRMMAFDHRAEVEKVLTPEQKKIWKEHRGDMRRDVRQRMMRRMGGAPGAGPGQGFGWSEDADDEKDVLIFIDEE
jgi:Spy/CpxP family protein refolding chaperone